MAEIVGYNGQIDLGGVIDSDVSYNTHAWSLDLSADALDTTNFTSTGWRKFIAGLKSWTGSCELYTDGTYRMVPSDVGTEVTGTFFLSDTTNYLTGKCLITGWSPAVSVEGVETQSISLQGSSDLTSS